MLPKMNQKRTVPIVDRLGLLEQSLPMAVASLSSSQVYVQWFKTWLCKKESYIHLNRLLNKIHVFAVYVSLYQSWIFVIKVLKHAVVLNIKNVKKQLSHS